MTDYSTDRLKTWRKWTDGPLLVLAIGSLPLLLLEIDRQKLTYADRIFLDVVNVTLLVAFAVVVRLVAIGGASTRQGRALVRKHAARFALGLAGLTLVTAAVGFTLAEDVGEHGRIHSFADAAWWSASTMTTLGADDIGPETAIGRMIALVVVLVGGDRGLTVA